MFPFSPTIDSDIMILNSPERDSGELPEAIYQEDMRSDNQRQYYSNQPLQWPNSA